MSIFISSRAIGTTESLLIEDDETVSWVSVPPSNAWVFGEPSTRSLDVAARLFHTDVPSFSEIPQAKFFSLFDIPPTSVSWMSALGRNRYKSVLNDMLASLRGVYYALNESGYSDRLASNLELLTRLERASIDTSMHNLLLKTESDPTQRGNLVSFTPEEDGLAKRVVYDLADTATGRMNVASGPRILTLRKDLRRIVKSSFDDGAVVSIDFTSLEPRVALALQGHSFAGDVYEWIDREVFDSRLGRSKAKIITLSIIYGMSLHSASSTYGAVTPAQKKRLLEIFGVESIKSMMRNTQKHSNMWGRPIYPDNEKKHFNAYIQSTAADLALEGFRSILESFAAAGVECNPVFLIHDEMVIDTRRRDIDKIKMILTNGVPIAVGDSIIRFALTTREFLEC